MPDLLSPPTSCASPAPLLVAALALLNRRCTRNERNAARLLQRAALSLSLSPTERETCLRLAEELER